MFVGIVNDFLFAQLELLPDIAIGVLAPRLVDLFPSGIEWCLFDRCDSGAQVDIATLSPDG